MREKSTTIGFVVVVCFKQAKNKNVSQFVYYIERVAACGEGAAGW